MFNETKKSWEEFCAAIRYAVGTKCPDLDISNSDFNEWWDLYEENKGWLWEFFPEDGRIEIPLKLFQGEDGEENDDGSISNIIMEAYREKVIEKARIVTTSSLELALADYDPDLVTKNRLSKKLSKEFVEEYLNYYCHLPIKDGLKETVMKICVGTKFKKVYETFLKYFDIDEKDKQELVLQLVDTIEFVRNQVSSNEEKVVISINPVDYALASTHTSSWNSCYRLDEGQYMSGTASCALDGVSIIAYAYKHKEMVDFGNDYYNVRIGSQPVKLWRQWIWLNKEGGFAIFGRNYPSDKPEYEKAARSLTGNLLAEVMGVSPKWKKMKYTETRYSANLVRNGYHDGDRISSVIQLKEIDNSEGRIRYGTNLPCPLCGSHGVSDGNFVCEDCADEPMYTCDDCGTGIYNADDYFTIHDGRIVCECCRDRDYSYCEYCDYLYPNDSVTWLANQDRAICTECTHDHPIAYCEDCGEYDLIEDGVFVNDKFYCSRCMDDNVEFCELCGEAFLLDSGCNYDSDGRAYCNDCIEKNELTTCERCGYIIRYGEKKVMSEGKPYCEQCSTYLRVKDVEEVAAV